MYLMMYYLLMLHQFQHYLLDKKPRQTHNRYRRPESMIRRCWLPVPGSKIVGVQHVLADDVRPVSHPPPRHLINTSPTLTKTNLIVDLKCFKPRLFQSSFRAVSDYFRAV